MPYKRNIFQQWGCLTDFEDLIENLVSPYLEKGEQPPQIYVVGFSKGANYSFKYICQ
jgi:predicted esterase